MLQKILDASGRVNQYIRNLSASKKSVCVAYSGGKDSKALRHLMRISGNEGVPVVHNCHEGETIENDPAIIKVPAPKAENARKFYEAAGIEAQLDGSRTYEDKTIIWDGKEIHRSQMQGPLTLDGVFGLETFCPLYDWTDADILVFLALCGDNIRGVNCTEAFISIEGEAVDIGAPSAFARFSSSLSAINTSPLRTVEAFSRRLSEAMQEGRIQRDHLNFYIQLDFVSEHMTELLSLLYSALSFPVLSSSSMKSFPVHCESLTLEMSFNAWFVACKVNPRISHSIQADHVIFDVTENLTEKNSFLYALGAGEKVVEMPFDFSWKYVLSDDDPEDSKLKNLFRNLKTADTFPCGFFQGSEMTIYVRGHRDYVSRVMRLFLQERLPSCYKIMPLVHEMVGIR